MFNTEIQRNGRKQLQWSIVKEVCTLAPKLLVLDYLLTVSNSFINHIVYLFPI